MSRAAWLRLEGCGLFLLVTWVFYSLPCSIRTSLSMELLHMAFPLSLSMWSFKLGNLIFFTCILKKANVESPGHILCESQPDQFKEKALDKRWMPGWVVICRWPEKARRWHPTPVLLPGESHGWRSLVGCSPWGREESDKTERLHFQFSLSCIGEGNGNPLQCSCLENPGDGGAWWAAVYGVAQSRTRLKWFSSSREGNGTPVQYSCLENLMDGEVWWAAVHGVAKSRTRLKWLSSSSSRVKLLW